ncbi:unnamed protein product [Psylliodes chrysocephalus]|uniref:Uncharacterized protein n=1 Tax=Psylliodes chrysocephalus TaxID=3402493 RepID=A0A9P0CG28_9CUCU|nr:unnamed protein product [Psylliodes chrysocephala]
MGAYGGTGKARNGVTTEQQQDLLAVSKEYQLVHSTSANIKDARGLASVFRKTFGRLPELQDQLPALGSIETLRLIALSFLFGITKTVTSPKLRILDSGGKFDVNKEDSCIALTKKKWKKRKKKEALEHQKEENRQKRLKQKLEKQAKPKQTKKSKVDAPAEASKTADTVCVDAPAETSKTADTKLVDAPAEVSKIAKNHPNSEKIYKTETIDEVKNNVIKRTGLCFSCVANITLNKIGIKCQECNRVYHMVCLKKRGVFKDFYRCGVCTVKLSLRS